MAGVILEASFVRFMVSIAVFNDDMGPSRRFSRWGFVAMVGKLEVAARKRRGATQILRFATRVSAKREICCAGAARNGNRTAPSISEKSYRMNPTG